MNISQSNTIRFNYIAYPGYKYEIEQSDALDQNWQNAFTHIGDGTATQVQIEYSTAVPSLKKGFYRVSMSE